MTQSYSLQDDIEVLTAFSERCHYHALWHNDGQTQKGTNLGFQLTVVLLVRIAVQSNLR